MAHKKFRFVFLAGLMALMFLVTSCAGGFAVAETTTVVSSEVINATMWYVEGPKEGPFYDVTMEVPADWVDTFQVRNIGNRLYFDYIGADNQIPAQVFFIEAVSPEQYWQQTGSYPGSYANIVNKGDTYFSYYLPIDTYYSDLPQVDFARFEEVVPHVIESFMAEAQ